MWTKVEQKLIKDGYVFKKQFTCSKMGAMNFAKEERKKGNLARVLNPRAFTHEVWVKEKSK